VQEDVAPKPKTAQQATVDAAEGLKPTSSHVKTVAQYALPVRILRVRGPSDLRVRRNPSLSSDQVGALRAGSAFAFSHVSDGWAKVSPLHYNDLKTSSSTCCLGNFEPHDAETQGYCMTQYLGSDVTDAAKFSVLSRFAAFFGI
jgi:hypothetical protein